VARRAAAKRSPGETAPDPSGIPDKPYFKIGEVARLCAVKPYVLRYWETEFKSVRPQKTRSQQRVYRRRDVELLLKIRHLLYDQRFTIEGARARLRELGHDEGAAPPAPPPEVSPETLRKIKQGLADLIRICAD
jgi:DNA-binding transcriptional MerR regulator